MVSQMEDFTPRAPSVAGAKASRRGITPKDIDHLMIYDASRICRSTGSRTRLLQEGRERRRLSATPHLVGGTALNTMARPRLTCIPALRHVALLGACGGCGTAHGGIGAPGSVCHGVGGMLPPGTIIMTNEVGGRRTRPQPTQERICSRQSVPLYATLLLRLGWSEPRRPGRPCCRATTTS
jgi:hypothetical protein